MLNSGIDAVAIYKNSTNQLNFFEFEKFLIWLGTITK